MNRDEFEACVQATRMTAGRTTQAAYLVLVDGRSKAEAAKLVKVSRAAVQKAVKRLQALRVCEKCGRAG